MGAERKLPPVTGPGRIDTEFAAPQLASDRLTPTSPEPLISFVVPAYNEASSLQDVLQRVYTLPLRAEVIAVDDGSTDRTAEILERFAESHGLIVIRHERNRGKGAAVRTGIARSTGEVVLIQDADMEYDPSDVPDLIRPIVEGYADVVYGSRLTGGRPQRAYMFWHLLGNRLLALLTNVLWNTTLSDMETGYKAFRGELVRSFELTEDDFRIEPEITAQVLDRKLRLYQLPIAYYGRAYDEGKKIGWRDGPPAVWTLLRLRFGSSRRRRSG
ncbi:MAG: glycosyltransferase family 2 protein [Actinobacteria bacterium]|nr:MAG: glycosyltransferase family 2 protein [Actinomycetota bacterium]